MRHALFAAIVFCAAMTASPARAQATVRTLSTQDYLDIQQLYARYNHAIDTGNAEAWADTFTPDGTFNTQWKNRDGLIAFIHRWVEQSNGANRRHWNSNLLVTPTPEGANGSVYLLLMDVGARPPAAVSHMKYTDTLVKTPQGWRFKTRVVKPDPEPPAAAR
ncbi:MAG: nuclear transport factor 2 family protein [Vicinamibacterales bacterium]